MLSRDIQKQLDAIKNTIKTERVRRGYTQAELANMCGLKKRTIGAIERGEMIGTLRTLSTIFSALGLEMAIKRKDEILEKGA